MNWTAITYTHTRHQMECCWWLLVVASFSSLRIERTAAGGDCVAFFFLHADKREKQGKRKENKAKAAAGCNRLVRCSFCCAHVRFGSDEQVDASFCLFFFPLLLP